MKRRQQLTVQVGVGVQATALVARMASGSVGETAARFLDELEDHMAEDAAEETLKTVVSWARFGELFSYDDDGAMFSLENPT